MDFTNDEMKLMCIYNAGSRKGTIKKLSEMRKETADDEVELRELTDSVLKKLRKMTDKSYSKIDFTQFFDPYYDEYVMYLEDGLDDMEEF